MGHFHSKPYSKHRDFPVPSIISATVRIFDKDFRVVRRKVHINISILNSDVDYIDLVHVCDTYEILKNFEHPGSWYSLAPEHDTEFARTILDKYARVSRLVSLGRVSNLDFEMDIPTVRFAIMYSALSGIGIPEVIQKARESALHGFAQHEFMRYRDYMTDDTVQAIGEGPRVSAFSSRGIDIYRYESEVIPGSLKLTRKKSYAFFSD